MSGVSLVTGPAVALPQGGIDTDQIIPARFMSRTREEGYGDHLFYDLRRDGSGALRRDFPLNGVAARVLVAGRNFGCGSSREAAVYALVDAGIGAVIASTFGDIFATNAVNNGLIPCQTPEAETLLARCPATLTVDLAQGRITGGPTPIVFALDATAREKLLNGWDDIDLTLSRADEIARFHDAYAADRPWAAHPKLKP